MAAENSFKMSQEHLNSLKERLDYLHTVREKEVAEQIKEARSFGDLSENSEYDEAKTEQGKLYSEIAELEHQIANAEVVELDTVTDGAVGHGSTVKLKNLEEDEEEVYTIVGSQETNPMEGKISDVSPIGRALLGKKKGETVVVEAPDGAFRYQILKIEKP